MNHWTNKKHKPESIEKMRLAKIGKKQSIETITKRVLKLKGRKFTTEHIKKISDAQKGEKGNNWKGDKAVYNSIHHWVRDTFGRPKKCQRCKGLFTGLRIHWANISGQYKRDKIDWIRLCAKCHRQYDKQNPIICKRLFSHK